MAEVYAGFLAHADDQIGRLLGYLEEVELPGEHDLIVLVSDNGAERRGRPEWVGQRDEVPQRDPRRRSRRTCPSSTISAARTPTTTTRTVGRWPSTRRSRCGSATSSTAEPATRASSPGPPASRPGARSATQYHHAIDLVPNDPRRTRRRRRRRRSRATCRAGSTASACATASTMPRRPTARPTQFYSMLGSRAIWHDGWKAVTNHPTVAGWSHFNDDEWELYHTESDRAELHNLADEHPEQGPRAGEPLVRRGGRERRVPARRPLAAGDHPDAATGPLTGLATVTSTSRTRPKCRSPRRSTSATAPTRSGRCSTFPRRARGRDLRPRVAVRRARALRQGEPTALRLQLRRHARADGGRERGAPDRGEPDRVGIIRQGRRRPARRCGRDVVALPRRDEGRRGRRSRPNPASSPSAARACIGRDAASARDRPIPRQRPWRFTGGTIKRVAVDVSGEPYIDLEREAVAMLMRE